MTKDMKSPLIPRDRQEQKAQVKINEIFNSISGEVSKYHQGVLTTFLRLSGCNLQCYYCDTDNSMCIELDEEEIIHRVLTETDRTEHLCITGGEPLLQYAFVEKVLSHVSFYKIKTWVETNGTIDFSRLIGKTSVVADYKLPFMKKIPSYFYKLTKDDFVKFVISNYAQLDKAITIQKEISKYSRVNFAYSPVNDISINYGRINESNTTLINQIQVRLYHEHLTGIINVQIHKYLKLK